MQIIQVNVEDVQEYGGGQVRSLAFSPDGKELAVMVDLLGDSRIAFWDLRRNVERKPVPTGGSDVEGAIPAVMSPDFQLIAHVAQDPEAHGVFAILSQRSRGKLVDRNLQWGWGLNITALCFSPDGRQLAVTGWDNDEDGAGEGIALWDVAAVLRGPTGRPGQRRWITREAAATLLPGEDFHASLAFSPDGRTLAAGMINQGITRWDLATLARLPTWRLERPGSRSWVGKLAFSPDGKTLAAMYDYDLIFFDTETGAVRPAQPTSYLPTVFGMAFHPAGQVLATVCLGNLVIFWDVANGKEQQRFHWDVEGLQCIAFSPDGCTCAAGGDAGHIVRWDDAS